MSCSSGEVNRASHITVRASAPIAVLTAVRFTAERRKCSASTMLTRAMSSSGYASESAVCATLGPSTRRLGEREAPGEREQRAADQPGVQAEADPARLGHRPLGEHQQAHDGGRREAQEEQVGVAGAGHRALEDDLVPPPDQVAQGRHRGGEREQQPGGSEADCGGCGRRGSRTRRRRARRGAQPEVAHDQRDFAASPSRARNRRRIPRTPGPAGAVGQARRPPRRRPGRRAPRGSAAALRGMADGRRLTGPPGPCRSGSWRAGACRPAAAGPAVVTLVPP